MKVCQFYLQGNCVFGLRCRNSHEKPSNGLLKRTQFSTHSKNNEIKNAFKEAQYDFQMSSVKAWTPQINQYSYLYRIPGSGDFSVCIQSQGEVELFIRNDLQCCRDPKTDRFEFLFRKQSDSSYLILDNYDCGRVVGYDKENNTIMAVSPNDCRSISWILEQIGSKVTIRHACLNRYWHVETLKSGGSKLVLKKHFSLDLSENLSSEFSLIRRLIPPRKELFPPIRDDIKLLPPILKTSQNIWDMRMNNYHKNTGIIVALDGCEVQNVWHTWAQARASHGLRGKGKFYYEGQHDQYIFGYCICRMGWSTVGAKELGHDAFGFGYGASAKSTKKKFENYGVPCNSNNIISCLLNLDEKTISFSVDGDFQGIAFHIPENVSNMALFPTVALNGGLVRLNLGATPFSYLPEGFSGIVNADLPNIVTALPFSHVRVRQHNFRTFYSRLSAYLEPLSEPSLSSSLLHEEYTIALTAQKLFLSNPAIKVLMLGDSVYRNLIADYL